MAYLVFDWQFHMVLRSKHVGMRCYRYMASKAIWMYCYYTKSKPNIIDSSLSSPSEYPEADTREA